MDYDYVKYDAIVIDMLNSAWRDPDELEIGENISDIPEVKIIFDGYGYNEETDEQDDKNLESYAIFIHKDALQEGFEFPEHDTTPWCLIHRPKEEVCLYAWYDVKEERWEINYIGDATQDTEMDTEDVLRILDGLNAKYFSNI